MDTINVDNVVTTGNVSLTATGAITELSPDAGVDITATSVTLSAVTGIGSANAIETTVTNITATNTGAGNISLAESNGANVLNVAASSGTATVISTTEIGRAHV